MADAGERGSDEAQQEKGNGVKGGMTAERAATILASAKAMGASPAPSLRAIRADSLRAHQLAARFGLAARHPLCQAALGLWDLDAQRAKAMENARRAKMLLEKAQQLKKQSRASLDHFYEKGKQKEVIIEDDFWHKVNEVSLKAQKAYQGANKCIAFHEEMRIYAAWQFGQELLAIERTKMKSVLRALSRVQKRWKALSNGKRLKYGELRELGILQQLQDKKIKAEDAKGRAVAAYMEAWFGGDRPLSDDEWQGRLTAREIHSHLAAAADPRVAGDKDAKEIRRLCKGLGLRLAKDQPGRKWKGPVPVKQEPKKKPGRPPTSESIKPLHTGNLAGVEALLVKAPRVVKMDSWIKTGKASAGIPGAQTEKAIARVDYAMVKTAQQDLAAIKREIDKLAMLRGGRRGKFVY